MRTTVDIPEPLYKKAKILTAAPLFGLNGKDILPA